MNSRVWKVLPMTAAALALLATGADAQRGRQQRAARGIQGQAAMCPMGGACCMMQGTGQAAQTGRAGQGLGRGPGMGMGPGAGLGRGSGMGMRRMGRGPGAGMGRMGGMMGGPQGRMAQDPTRRNDMTVFHFLVDNHKKVQRKVMQLFDGVETVTESDDPEVAAKIQEHVPAMYARLKEGRGIHLMDPLFVALFENGKKIDSQVTFTEKGVRVVETSQDDYTVKLIKAHAKSVDELVAKGRAGMAPHAVPKR